MKHIIILSLILTVFMGACSNHDSETDKHEGHHHGEANHHMHKRDFKELVADFEAPERDAWQKPATVLAFFGDLKDKTVMDIGAGTGYFSFKITDSASKIIAADPDEKFIDYLNQRLSRENRKNIEIRKAEYEKPPLNANEVDLVFMIDVYHHIENRVAYFKQVKSGLKKNGKMAIIDFKKGELPKGPPDEMKISTEQITSELKDAGFSLVKIDTSSLPYQFMLLYQ